MTRDKLERITSDTLVPVSVLAVLAGGVFWLSAMYSQVQANSKSLETYNATVGNIDKRLSRIEGKLGVNE